MLVQFSSDSFVALAFNPGPRALVLPRTDELAALDPSWVRYLLSASFQDFQTGRNTELDWVIQNYRARGVKILALINPETLGKLPPTDPNGWANYNTRVADLAQKIATFYRGAIDALEIFNEPETQNILPEDYAALLNACYPKIKAVSAVPVISAGICCGINYPYLERVMELARDSCDAVGWHPYGMRVDGYPFADWGFGDLRTSITRARAIARKPLWITEIGAELAYQWGAGIEPAHAVAEYLTRAFGLMRELGADIVARAFWFTWRISEAGWGLVDDAGTRRPAWYALQQQTHLPPISITSVKFDPTTLAASQQLGVSITVKNNSNMPLATQDPQPGIVYNEGDTFYSRDFPDVPGAMRVAIDFDGRVGIDHPYRWGLGAPLAPGETRTITGAIRLHTPIARNYWAGVVQEQIAWHHDAQGAQLITVQPSVEIRDVKITPTILSAGQFLHISATVSNNGVLPLATQGPDPGFIYDEGDSFISRGFADATGNFRVGVDFATRTGMDHPYRWGLGTPLAPGEARTITGLIRVKHPQTQLYWTGLVQEHIAWIQDRVGVQAIQVIESSDKLPEIVSVNFSVAPDRTLNFSITLKNTRATSLPTQDPQPGFVYDEGDTFYSRDFPDVPGAMRVAIDFDNRTGVDHPYRWGLGAPLAPGETRTITGAIRLATAQAQNYWAGVVEERVAWLRDREGVQMIRVE